MKRILTLLLLLSTLAMLVLPLSASASPASASMTGQATVRANDTITLTFKINDGNTLGVSGSFDYDSTQVEFLSYAKDEYALGSSWEVDFSGDNMVAFDDELVDPITSEKTLFTAKFKVKNIAPGTKVTISMIDVVTSDGNDDTKLGTISYSVIIAEPLSANNSLASLTVKNATITPAFSANVTSYTADVPFSVSKLEIDAKAADAKASVKINSPTLTPDGNTDVTITVTAEDGSKKTYTIKVHRAKDPNYVPEGKNDLASITVEGFVLSPQFDKNKTEYVVWVPYETESVTVRGTADSSKASIRVEGGETLTAGADNAVKIICKAENGTEKVYTVIVKRAAPHGETNLPVETDPPVTDPPVTDPPATNPPESDPVDSGTVTTTPSESEPDRNDSQSIAKETVPSETNPETEKGEVTKPNTLAIPIVYAVIIGLGCLIVGIIIGTRIGKK